MLDPGDVHIPSAVKVKVPTQKGEVNKSMSVLSGKAENDLPDSAFLYIEPGGKKDKDGKTVPRGLRHFPYRNAQGGLDEAHIRNALGRIPQSSVSADAKASALAKAKRYASQVGIKVAASEDVGCSDVDVMMFPIGHYSTSKYDDLDLTRPVAESIVQNFKDKVLGETEPFIEASGRHDQSAPAEGWIKDLSIRPWAGGEALYAKVHWNKHGEELIRGERYRYISPYFGPHKVPETGEIKSPVLKSGCLTNVPVLRMMGPVAASEADLEAMSPFGLSEAPQVEAPFIEMEPIELAGVPVVPRNPVVPVHPPQTAPGPGITPAIQDEQDLINNIMQMMAQLAIKVKSVASPKPNPQTGGVVTTGQVQMPMPPAPAPGVTTAGPVQTPADRAAGAQNQPPVQTLGNMADPASTGVNPSRGTQAKPTTKQASNADDVDNVADSKTANKPGEWNPNGEHVIAEEEPDPKTDQRDGVNNDVENHEEEAKTEKAAAKDDAADPEEANEDEDGSSATDDLISEMEAIMEKLSNHMHGKTGVGAAKMFMKEAKNKVAAAKPTAKSKQLTEAMLDAMSVRKEMKTKMTKLTEKFGLSEEASEDAILAAFEAREVELTEAKDEAERKLAETEKALTEANDKLTEAKKAKRAAKVEKLLSVALAENKILPADIGDDENPGWLRKLALSDYDLFKEVLSSQKDKVAVDLSERSAGENKEEDEISPENAHVKLAELTKEYRLAHPDVDYGTCQNRVLKENKALAEAYGIRFVDDKEVAHPQMLGRAE